MNEAINQFLGANHEVNLIKLKIIDEIKSVLEVNLDAKIIDMNSIKYAADIWIKDILNEKTQKYHAQISKKSKGAKKSKSAVKSEKIKSLKGRKRKEE